MTHTLRFRVLGDSLAAGVGCTTAHQTLGHRLADVLRADGHRVDLGVHAVPGARSIDLAPQVRAAVPTGVDLALLVIGANDLTSFTPPAIGARLLHDAVANLRRAGARVVVATAPDLGIVSRVPPAYRDLVSQASAMYARAQADAVRVAGGTIAAVGTELFDRFRADPALFSADGFHPSAAGYALIADALAPHVRDAAGERAA
ncbi:SGNH/GDSL hydrolase family protein [Saccharothrix syringae]|uniref:SGNH/GDSL hydrolase family protein n=1 Tax=Saccharothrix syringae TaxID=103733 RepID=UPI000525C97D|nr:SGNH/GDSL hydrolase family protein [Saccharothrix syringae]